MSQFKLIKEYPGSPSLEQIYTTDDKGLCICAVTGHQLNLTNYPGFWEEMVQIKTQDGVVINLGDKFISLNVSAIGTEDYTIRGECTLTRTADQKAAKENGVLWFSSIEAVNEYIALHKPVFSVNDMLDIASQSGFNLGKNKQDLLNVAKKRL